MAIKLDIRNIESSVATEIYVSATPGSNTSIDSQWEEIFSSVKDVIDPKNACIMHERVFGTQSAVESAFKIRSGVYGKIDDGVVPTLLVSKEGLLGPIAGVQIQAVACDRQPEVIELDGKPCGRILQMQGQKQITLSGISAANLPNASEQALAMLEKGESVLTRFGSDFFSVARTWMWLKDILCWYDDFNEVRNQFFTERGLIGKGRESLMPASTGIGLSPFGGGWCSMDMTAVLEPRDSIEYLKVTGKQHCAYEYGSAFSRATGAISPAGKTVVISGTASIDSSGATTNIGDAGRQIEDTIENVCAVLREMQCDVDGVVQVVAYCKTTEVERVFNAIKDKPAWPWVTAICDVCRDDLLFEIEAAALRKS